MGEGCTGGNCGGIAADCFGIERIQWMRWVRFCQPRRHVVWVAKGGTSSVSSLQRGRAFPSYVVPPRFLSWVRVMHDDLAHSLHRTQGTRLRTNLVAKNAVGPAFFESCTSSKVANNTHIVLIDLATNLFSGALEQLVSRLREVAPHAVVALIAWVKRSECSLAHANINTMRDLGNADADVMQCGRHPDAYDRAVAA